MKQACTPVRVGRNTLPNRLIMAPMTRSRAQVDGTPGDLAVEYYAQRASVGLIVAEGTQPSDDGQGYLLTPGIYTPAHIAGWKKVTTAVHAKGGHIFIQLMHVGRMSHPDNTPHHRQALAPSAVAPGSQMFTAAGMKDIPTPRSLTSEEIRQTVVDFRHAARSAIDAGADGVEIHGANSYLVHQFLAANTNQRTDQYGGSIENRARFAIEVVKAIAAEIGADRTAIRLSPGFTMWGIDEGPESPALYRYLVAELDKLGLAYLHVIHPSDGRLMARHTSTVAAAVDTQSARPFTRPDWCRCGIGIGRSRSLRTDGPSEPRPGDAIADQCTDQRAGSRQLLWRNRAWLHGLSGAARVRRAGGPPSPFSLCKRRYR